MKPNDIVNSFHPEGKAPDVPVVHPDTLIKRFLEIITLDMILFFTYLALLQKHLIQVYSDELILRYIDKYESADKYTEQYLQICHLNKDYDEKPYEILKRLLRVMIYHPTEWNDEFASVFKSIPRPRDFDAKEKRDLKKFVKNASNSDRNLSEPNKSDEFIQIKKLLKMISRKEKIQFNQKWQKVLLMKQAIDFPQKKM